MTTTASHDNPSAYRRVAARWLPIYLRLLAVGFLLFWGTALTVSTTGIQIPAALDHAARWGHGHGMDAAGAMLAAVYVVWALFIWAAAADPLGNRMFLDFTVLANMAHFGLMFVMALYMDHEQHHLYKDVLLGWVGIIPLAILWWPLRSTASTTLSDPHAEPAATQ